jgi:hypothetical protein
VRDLRAVFKAAEELANAVTEPYRPEAFTIAATELLRGGSVSGPATDQTSARGASRPRRTERRGPKHSVEQLIEDGFFTEPRTIRDVQRRIGDHYGHRFTQQELSPALVRLVRGQRLQRSRSADDQFRYSIPDA